MMIKKIAITLLLIVALSGAALYVFRHAIIRYYADKIIREKLPPYIKIDRVKFDFVNNRFSVINFGILDSPDFPQKFLLKIDEISCRYGIIGKTMPQGLEISEVVLKGANINIQRIKDGRINIVDEDKFISSLRGRPEPHGFGVNSEAEAISKKESAKPVNRKLSDLLKLPNSFEIKDSKFEFLDELPYDKPHLITVESINGNVSIGFSDNYSKITNLAFTLTGCLNDDEKESIKWIGSLNPVTPRITMSNRIEVANLDLVAFEPYYDKFAPFVFKRGGFSGVLVFDFNNGDIGSSNEVRLSDLAFYVKPGYENAQMWETNVPDLMKYFTTTSGDIVFDFKLKGDITSPVFYLGPISKRALTAMAIDKVTSYAMDQVAKQTDGATGTLGKAKDTINALKGLLNKK